MLWTEALGRLDTVLSVPINELSLNDVRFWLVRSDLRFYTWWFCVCVLLVLMSLSVCSGEPGWGFAASGSEEPAGGKHLEGVVSPGRGLQPSAPQRTQTFRTWHRVPLSETGPLSGNTTQSWTSCSQTEVLHPRPRLLKILLGVKSVTSQKGNRIQKSWTQLHKHFYSLGGSGPPWWTCQNPSGDSESAPKSLECSTGLVSSFWRGVQLQTSR